MHFIIDRYKLFNYENNVDVYYQHTEYYTFYTIYID